MSYQIKYLKYKKKYLELKKTSELQKYEQEQEGGDWIFKILGNAVANLIGDAFLGGRVPMGDNEIVRFSNVSNVSNVGNEFQLSNPSDEDNNMIFMFASTMVLMTVTASLYAGTIYAGNVRQFLGDAWEAINDQINVEQHDLRLVDSQQKLNDISTTDFHQLLLPEHRNISLHNVASLSRPDSDSRELTVINPDSDSRALTVINPDSDAGSGKQNVIQLIGGEITDLEKQNQVVMKSIQKLLKQLKSAKGLNILKAAKHLLLLHNNRVLLIQIAGPEKSGDSRRIEDGSTGNSGVPKLLKEMHRKIKLIADLDFDQHSAIQVIDDEEEKIEQLVEQSIVALNDSVVNNRKIQLAIQNGNALLTPSITPQELVLGARRFINQDDIGRLIEFPREEQIEIEEAIIKINETNPQDATTCPNCQQLTSLIQTGIKMLNEKEREVTELKIQISAQENYMRKLDTYYVEAKEELRITKSILAEKISELDDVNKRLKEAGEKIKELEKNLASNDIKISDLMNTKDELLNIIEQARNELKDLKEESTNKLNQTVSEKNKEIERKDRQLRKIRRNYAEGLGRLANYLLDNAVKPNKNYFLSGI